MLLDPLKLIFLTQAFWIIVISPKLDILLKN